mmetsp:Transcript_14518/g.42394  ORF Transcript_14518/g.42394 Transcript_14518/m.42394 type:complete len:260 (-) Transcript_14518:408-1187(-)
MHTYFDAPPATRNVPSAPYTRLVKHAPLSRLPAARRSDARRPPRMSRRPSMMPSVLASCGSQSVMQPSSVDTASCLPSGRNATASASCVCCSVSIAPLPLYTSQVRAVLSQEPVTSMPPSSGLKATHDTGPSCPDRMSSRRPVFRLHTYTWKLSTVPAATISPPGSTATHPNCTGVGDAMVRKLRYRTRSYARTVPSSDADTSACPDGRNATAVTGAACSENVTKQKPLDCWKTLTLRSSEPVAMSPPSGENATAEISK